MISVVIRVKNEGKNLKRCIEILKSQTVPNEIVIVDSNSTDDTLDICDGNGVKVVQCTEPFTYGKALNQGINSSTGNFVCILSAHCFPVSKDFLFNMFKNFSDKKVGAVYARQIPHPLTNPVEYRNFLHIYGNERIVQRVNPLFNNGASMINKRVWEQVRFDEDVIAQEDMLWAKMILDKGFHIVYDPSSVVEHLHNEDIIHTVSRYERESRALQGMGCGEW